MSKSLNGNAPDLPTLDPNTVVKADASGQLANLDNGTTGFVLTSTGTSTIPTWQAGGGGGGTATNIAGGLAGEVAFQTAPSTTTFTNATAGVLQSDGTTPAFAATITKASGITGVAASDFEVAQTAAGKRIKLSTLDTSIQMFQGATNVGEFTTSGATFPQVTTGNTVVGTTGFSGTYSTDSLPIQTSTPAINFSLASFQTPSGGTFFVGKGNAGTPSAGTAVDDRGVLWTATAKPIDIVPNTIAALTAKTDGTLQFQQHTSALALKTDSSGNVGAISTPTGTGTTFVLSNTPTLVTPNIGVATGTSLTTGNTVIATGGITTQTSLGTPLIDTTASTDASFIDFKNTIGLNHVFIGKANAATPGIGSAVDGCAVLWSTAKPVDIIAGNTAALTAKTDGTLKFYQHPSAIALNTDASGNVGSASTTGTGTTLVLSGSPSLTSPDIGAATGTSLQLSGLTASKPVSTDASKNLISSTTTGTGTTVVLDNTPTLITPIIGTATATSILGSAGADLDLTQSTTARRIKLTTLDRSVQIFKGATNVGEFDSSGATFPANVTVTGANANVTLNNLEMDGSGEGQYQAVCANDNDAYYASNASGKYIRARFTDLTNDAYYGLNASAQAEISTSTAKDIVLKPNSIAQFTVKSGGVVQIPHYPSVSFLGTDASGNIQATSVSTTGTGAFVLQNTPTLITPNIGVATGTSLQLSGLTASSALATDASKNLVSVTNNGTGNNVLTTSPALVTPTLGNALATTVSTAKMILNASQLEYIGSGPAVPFYAQGDPGDEMYTQYSADATVTTGIDVSGNAVIKTSGTGTKDFVVLPNNVEKFRVKTSGVVQMPNYVSSVLSTDGSGNIAAASTTGTAGTAVVLATSPALVTPNIGAATGTSLQLSGLTASAALATDASKNLVSITNNGTGNNVLTTSPALVTPNIGVANGTSLTTGAVVMSTAGITRTVTGTDIVSATFTADNTKFNLMNFNSPSASSNIIIGRANSGLLTSGNAVDGKGVFYADGSFPIEIGTSNTTRFSANTDGSIQFWHSQYQNQMVWYSSVGKATPIVLGASGTRLIGNGTTTAPSFASITTPLQRVFTSGTDATYTPTTGCINFQVEIIGGGGGAGGGTQNGPSGKAGGGGAGGGYVKHTYPASGTYTYTVGAGGAGGAGSITTADATAGTAGGSTLWKVSATTKLTGTAGGGGVAGGGSAGTNVDGNGGAAGVPTSGETGSFLAYGGDGGYGKDKNGGSGGSTRMGGARLGAFASAVLTNGLAGVAYGQGGSGGVYGGTGGAGFAGVVLITEWF